MKVGDLVKVIYDGTLGLIVRIEEDGYGDWAHLHTGESFKIDWLEVIHESR